MNGGCNDGAHKSNKHALRLFAAAVYAGERNHHFFTHIRTQKRPRLVKIPFCVALTYLFLSAFPFPEDWTGAASLTGYFLMCAKELLFGASLGFIMTVFFDLVYSAGQLMDMQIGFGVVSVYDIQNNSQVPVVGNLLNLVLLILFYAVNGHLKVIAIIYSTIQKVPIGHVIVGTNIVMAAWEAFSLSCILAAMVAMPLLPPVS